MINIIGEYIKYRWKARQRFGVHSPFVFDFGDKCLRLFVPNSTLQGFKQLRNHYLKSHERIEVNDLGAGSRVLKNHRKISDIVKVSGVDLKYGKLLYRISTHYKPKNILELGTSLGLGTYMLVSGNDKSKVTTIEGCVNTLNTAKTNFPKQHLHQVDFINDSFENYLSTLDNQFVFDLIYIDGDHKSRSLFFYLELLKNHIHDETIIILDDIRWTKDMLDGWKMVKEQPQFHLSLDLFRLGIIVPRKHQQKEHFVIRY
ncbi:MAG: class I SAM-dependent methyltransferase [Brumimicrobium sp.]